MHVTLMSSGICGLNIKIYNFWPSYLIRCNSFWIVKLQWDPPSLDKVSEDMVDQYFSPLSELEPDLDLPTKVREAFT